MKSLLLAVYAFAFLSFVQSGIIDTIKDIHSLPGSQPVSQRNFKFSYKNCGPSTDPVIIDALNIDPDPLKIPGNVSFSTKASVKTEVNGPITASLKIIKIIGKIKITIPCIASIGSCTYPDVCSMIKPDSCPDIFKKLNISCSCPIAAREYDVPTIASLIQIPGGLSIPGGEYNIIIDFKNSVGHLGCLDMMYNFA